MMLQIRGLSQSLCVLILLAAMLVKSRPMQADLSTAAIQSIRPNTLFNPTRNVISLNPTRNAISPFKPDNAVSYGSASFLKNPLYSNSILRPSKAVDPAKRVEYHELAAGKDGLTQKYEEGVIDIDFAQKDIQQMTDEVLNPDHHPSLTKGKDLLQIKEEAANKIADYIKAFKKAEGPVTEALTALLRIVRHDPNTDAGARKALYSILSSEDLSPSTRQIYLDLVQKQAWALYDRFSIKPFKRKYKNVISSKANKFWKSAKSGSSSEEKLANIMQETLARRRTLLPNHVYLIDHWDLWIGIFYGVVQRARNEKIDMFDMLYRYGNPKGLFQGHDLSLVIAKEEQIAADAAARSLAMEDPILRNRYETLLKLDARRALLDNELGEFALKLSMEGNPKLQLLAHILSQTDDFIAHETIIFKTQGTLNRMLRHRLTWNDDFKSTVSIVFQYGKSLIAKYPDRQSSGHLTMAPYEAVIKMLTEFSDENSVLEKRIFASEALDALNLFSTESGLNTKRITALSYLESIRFHIPDFEKYINAVLRNLMTTLETGREGNIMRTRFLEILKTYEDEEMMGLVRKLFQASNEISNDQKYGILNNVKLLINHRKPQIIRGGQMMSSSNWRLILLLNFTAGHAWETKNMRFLNHVLVDLEELTYSTSILNQKLAGISLKMWNEHLHQALPSVTERRAVTYL